VIARRLLALGESWGPAALVATSVWQAVVHLADPAPVNFIDEVCDLRADRCVATNVYVAADFGAYNEIATVDCNPTTIWIEGGWLYGVSPWDFRWQAEIPIGSAFPLLEAMGSIVACTVPGHASFYHSTLAYDIKGLENFRLAFEDAFIPAGGWAHLAGSKARAYADFADEVPGHATVTLRNLWDDTTIAFRVAPGDQFRWDPLVVTVVRIVEPGHGLLAPIGWVEIRIDSPHYDWPGPAGYPRTPEFQKMRDASAPEASAD
jgi:hypothetical protein